MNRWIRIAHTFALTALVSVGSVACGGRSSDTPMAPPIESQSEEESVQTPNRYVLLIYFS